MASARRIAITLFLTTGILVPLSFASAASISIASLSSGTVTARTQVTFNVVASGFIPSAYQLSDSFGTSTSVSLSDLTLAGAFTWTPGVSDVGTHALTITASDYSGDSASTTQTIIVQPPPSLAIGSLSPGASVMPGTTVTFSVSPSGFTAPKYIAGDSFSGSSITDANIDSSGNFSWKPDQSEQGTHTITIYANDSSGHGANVSQTIQVGAGPSITVTSVPSSTTINVGQTLSFNVVASAFSPTGYTVGDSFAGTTTIASANFSSTNVGSFSWTPQESDVGTHVLTITGIVGAYGQSATTTETVIVAGPGGAAPAPSTPASAASSLASTTALQAQLQQLQAQIAALSGSTTASALAPSPGFTFRTYLHVGLSSDDVSQLQTILSRLAFFSGSPTGYFGPLTTAAVKKFQAAHGLPQLGVVGPATRAALNALLTVPQSSTSVSSTPAQTSGYAFSSFIGFKQTGTAVIELQKRLAALGFFSGSPTGYFGPVTEAAVKQFQIAHGITAAGYVGPATRAALNQR